MQEIQYIENIQTPYVNVSQLFLFSYLQKKKKKKSIGETITKTKVLLPQDIELSIREQATSWKLLQEITLVTSDLQG